MKRSLILFLSLLATLSAAAQQPAPFKAASNITKGVLPNGISYYLVSNPGIRGFADFALIQQGMSSNPAAGQALASLPGFSKIRPYRYMASKGVGYRSHGYIDNPSEAAIFRFDDVPVYDRTVSDSTLLMIFDIMKTSPMEQALVVSGDIDREKLLQQIQMMSLSVPERSALSDMPVYMWEPSDTAGVILTESGADGVADFSVAYRAPRSARTLMNTPRTVLSGMYAAQLEEILFFRIRAAFRDAGIPIDGLSYDYLDSSQTSGDEIHTISFRTSEDKLEKAVSLFAGTLAEIDRNGVSADELQDAVQIVRKVMYKSSGKEIRTNAEYVQRCIASYLYGANLASASEIHNYFAGRNLDPETELELFNLFCSALLSPDTNVTIAVGSSSGNVRNDRIRQLFADSWEKNRTRFEPGKRPQIKEYSGKKIKIKTVLPDPVTGGEVWIFSNGMKVVYRKTDDSNQLRYAFLLQGGSTSIPDLVRGENAFVEDVIGLFRIGGMTCDEFRRYLASNGISMETDLTMTDLRFIGTAPTDKFQTFLQCLRLFGYSRSLDKKDFMYYRECVGLEMQADSYNTRGIRKAMDEICCPGFAYPDYKLPQNITPNLPDKVERYLSSLFSKCDDGVLIIAGGIEPAQAKDILCRNLGGFLTGRKHTGRPAVDFPTEPGWHTYTAEAKPGCGPGIFFMARKTMPVSQKTRMAFKIACDAIETSLEKVLADKGYSVAVSGSADLFPTEMVTLRIECRPCPESGLPSGVHPSEYREVLNAVRSVITRLANTPVDPARLEVYRQNLLYRQETRTANPDYIIHSSLVRYSEGRDIVSGSVSQIKAVGVSDVEAVFRALDEGIKVEYIQK